MDRVNNAAPDMAGIVETDVVAAKRREGVHGIRDRGGCTRSRIESEKA